MLINANGSVGVFSAFGTPSAVMQSAIDKGYIKLGDQRWRNIKSTGNLTWSGQTLNIQYNASNVATGTIWRDCTFSLSADGQTLTHVYPTSDGTTTTMTTATYTRVSTYSLDGVWEGSNGMRINANGSVGVFGAFGTTSAVMQSAIDKGYIKLGDQRWRNITRTGNLTWSGQTLNIQYNASNVATGTIWRDCTFSMSADGQTLTHVYPITEVGGTTTMTTVTYTRIQ
jgi:Flp pilus assembly protein TadG